MESEDLNETLKSEYIFSIIIKSWLIRTSLVGALNSYFSSNFLPILDVCETKNQLLTIRNIIFAKFHQNVNSKASEWSSFINSEQPFYNQELKTNPVVKIYIYKLRLFANKQKNACTRVTAMYFNTCYILFVSYIWILPDR